MTINYVGVYYSLYPSIFVGGTDRAICRCRVSTHAWLQVHVYRENKSGDDSGEEILYQPLWNLHLLQCSRSMTTHAFLTIPSGLKAVGALVGGLVQLSMSHWDNEKPKL